MKNKLYYILLGILVCFSFMGSVFAADLDFVVSATPSSSTVVKGKEVTITLNLKSDSPIDVCQFKVESDSTLEFVTMSTVMSTGNVWKIGEGTISNFLLENGSNPAVPLTNGENVLEVKYIVNGDGKVTIKTVECSSVVDTDNSYSGTHDDVVVNITSKDISSDTTLSKLEVTGGKLLTPITTSTAVPYAITLDSPTFGLNPTASNTDYQDDIVIKDGNGNVVSDWSNITFSGDGGQTQMLMTITVNEQTTYNLLIEYIQTELNNSLKSVTINGAELNLVDGQYEYEYTIGKDTTSFDVSAVLSDSTNFKIGEDSNAPGNFSINDVVDVIIIVEPVSSDIGASAVTYNIRVTREGSLTEKPSDDDKDDGEDDKPSSGGTSGGGTSGSSGGNVNNNPSTGEISMFLMAFILIASLVGSIILYQKNLESYK